MSLEPRGGSRGSIAIVGAGLGGLTAALALLRSGWRVRVYEQAVEIGEVGAGITLSPGSGRALASLGLGPALLAASLPVPDVAFLHYRTGALLAGKLSQESRADRAFDVARHIHRADLHSILLAGVLAADPNAVLAGHRLDQVEESASGVSLVFGNGRRCAADLVVGADGVRSAVRQRMFEASPPEFAGQIAYRFLVSTPLAAPFLGAGAAAVFVGAGRIFHRYAIRGGSIMNVIGIARSSVWEAEGWNTPATREEFLAAYADFHPDVVGLIGQAPSVNFIKWGLFVRPPLEHWSCGPVVLIGDAAHPILPFLGLGAALAIEDGIVLSRALDTAPSIPSALEAYERARRDRVELVRTQTILQGEMIQGTDPDKGGIATSPSQRADLFEYDPQTASIQV